MQKNTASQKWIVFAFEDEGGTNPGEPVTGDAANITANVRIDGGAANAVDDVNPTELEDGYYIFDITAAESNGNNILITPQSSTANVNVIGVPGAVWTTPASFNASALATATNLTTVDTVVDGIQTDLSNGTDGLGALKTLIDANQTDLNTIITNVGTVDTVVDGIQTDLSNGTDGLGAIKTAVDAIPTSNPTAAAIADQVWDEAKAGHVVAGSFGEEVQAHALSSEVSALNDVAATDIVSGGAITTSGGIASSDVKKINSVTITGDGSVTPFDV